MTDEEASGLGAVCEAAVVEDVGRLVGLEKPEQECNVPQPTYKSA